MIAPRLVWMPPDFDVAYVSKSDYDELKAKLTATQSELAKIYATEPVAVYEGVEFSRYTLRWVNGDLAVGTNFYAAPIPPRIKDFSELRDEVYAAPIPPTDDAIAWSKRILALVDAYTEQPNSATRTKLRCALMDGFTAPIPPDEPKLKRASLMAFGVISEIRKLVGNGKVQFVADLGGSIWTWPDAADSAITELRSVCFDAAPIQPTPSQQEALDSLAGLLLGIELPQGKALVARQERVCCLRDFILARPDTEGSGK